MKTFTPSHLLLSLLAALSLSLVLPQAPAHAEEADAFKCLSGNEAECAYENESLTLFIRCRDAFDKGRETGDLTEARTLAKQLVERKNKYGKRMMKIIYVALSTGSHKNYVEAYRWIEEGIANNEQYPRMDLNKIRNDLAAKMTEQQLAEAKRK